MQFGVLGRLEICRADGSPVTVAGPARRQVLAALLARSGALVSANTLIEDLWGSAAPRNAIGNLRSHVARLRDNLGRDQDVLTTEGDGYRLRIAPDDLDASRFERLVAHAGNGADPVHAIDLYDQALALWRDDAYAEFGDAPFAVSERVRLAELRARARERRTDLALDLGRAGDLIAELEQRVRSQPYRERGWEQLAIALYRDGRQGDALHACRRARKVLVDELGVDPGPGLQEVENRILHHDPGLIAAAPEPIRASGAVVGQCPYLGLTGYGERDAAIFVGRERLISVLAGQLSEHSVVVLTGASGVGKSSLVRAGLVPALRAGAVPGSAGWRIAVHTPTTPGPFSKDGRHPDLLILDQAEELLSALDLAATEALLTELSQYVTYGDGRLLLVLRSDYYGRLADDPHLAEYAGKATVFAGPMRADELRRALIEPAATAGLRLEPELVETIMEDVGGQAEPLPLLSEAMVRTWQNRDADLLTLDGYRRAGGVAGALEAAAEECFERLDADARIAARRILVRMAAPSGAGGWVRRPLPTVDLSDTPADRQAVEAFARSRLIVIAGQQLEIAHDALLVHWPRLHEWLDERAAAVDLLDHLSRAASSWRSSGRRPEDLYRGPRLTAASEWCAAHPEDVSADEREFLDESERAAQAELNTAREQVAREARGRRRLRRVVAGLAACVVLAIGGGALALTERSTAQHQAGRATQAALTADASRLATLAGTLSSGENDVALLLGAEAYELQPSDVSAGGLQTALMQVPDGLDRVVRYPSPAISPHLDATGRLLAVPGSAGASAVSVFDLVGGRLIRALPWPTPRRFAVFSGDDRFVAAGGTDGTVAIWDRATGRPSGAPLSVGDGVVNPVFDPRDDNRLYVISSHGGLSAWDRSDPAHPRLVNRFAALPTFVTVGSAPSVTISADGHFVAAGEVRDGGGNACIWDVRTGRIVRSFSGASIGAFAPGGHLLPVGFGNDTLLVDASTGTTRATVANTGGNSFAVLTIDGHRLAAPNVVAGSDVVTVYDVASGTPVSSPLQVGGNATVPLGFLPDGRMVTGDADAAAIWSLGKDLPPIALRLDVIAGESGAAPEFLAGRSDIVVPNDVANTGLIRYDPATGRPTGPLLLGAANAPVAARRDGRFIAAVTDSGVGIWDAGTRSLVTRLPGLTTTAAEVGALRWSADGRFIAADVGGAAPYVWDVSDPHHPGAPHRVGTRVQGVIDDLQFTPDGRRLVLTSSGEPLFTAVDIATDRVVWSHTVGTGYLRQWAMAPNGTDIAVDSGYTDAGSVTILAMATGRPLRSIALPTWGGIGYVDGGRWLVVGSDQPTPQAHLYDATTLQAFGQSFTTGDPDQHPMAVDPNGTRFVETLEQDIQRPLFSQPLVWTVDPASWIHTACTIAGRNLTRAEWQQYLPGRPYRRTCADWPTGT